MDCEYKSRILGNGWCNVSCRYCNLTQESYCEHNKQTNADRIRAMSDEELAGMFHGGGLCSYIQDNHNDFCDAREACDNCVLDWLRQPVMADLFGVSVDSLLGIETCLKPMSRGDCYRNMPDDKLAVALMRLIDQGDAPFCQCKSECKMHIDDITTEMCVSCMVDYLKQPAEEAVYG